MKPLLHRQHGAVTIMVAVAMLILLAVVGLVIDSGLAYMVKARLNAAVDSAAVAAARAVTAGNSQKAQRASARTAAEEFFAANIPNGYLSSAPKITQKTVTFDGAGTVTIDITAEAPMPVSIMQVLGFTSMKPVASAQTIRRDLDMALVVDTSGSLEVDGSSSTVRKSAVSFLNKFNVTQDRVGLIRFSNGAKIDYPISKDIRGFDRAAMTSTIGNYKFTGGTSSVEGLWNARDQLNLIPLTKRSAMRVIVFFSDGQPTGLGAYQVQGSSSPCPIAGGINDTGSGLWKLTEVSTEIGGVCDLDYYPAKKLPVWYNAHNTKDDPAYREFRVVTDKPRAVTDDISTRTMLDQNVGRAAYNLAEAVAAKAREEGIFVFTLGLGAQLKTSSGFNGENNEAFLKCMANVADGPSRCYNPAQRVGMYCYAATDADLTPCFSKLASAILRISK